MQIIMLREKLQEALESRDYKVKTYTWKGKKVKTDSGTSQDEVKLVDATEEQLREFRKHCVDMLYNTNKENPGRYVVLWNIIDQRKKCNAELYIRSIQDKGVSRYSLNEQINKVVEGSEYQIGDLIVGSVDSSCDSEFYDIPLNYIVDGCLDQLGVFSRKQLTLNFILKQGVWLTDKELEDFTVKDEDGKLRPRVEVIKEKLKINPNIKLKINSKGLSFSVLKSMLQLKNKKYSDMTTEQLLALRNRILFNLENEVRHHVRQWEARIEQIDEVLKYKGFEQ
jgi:hypothetical protein